MRPKNVANPTRAVADAVHVLALDLAKGKRTPRAWHDWGQFIHARDGVMTVTTEQGSWVVPPARAVWVPPGVEHSVLCHTASAMRTIYLGPGRCDGLPAACGVVEATPLLRALVVELVERPAAAERAGHLLALILDDIRTTPVLPLHLPEPATPALRRVTAMLRADPGDGRPLAAWARLAGLGGRTLERRFRAETGMSLGRWRRHARLLEALVKLAAREPVTTTALDTGYESPSAFIHAFRKTFGVTPGRFFGRDRERSHVDRRDRDGLSG